MTLTAEELELRRAQRKQRYHFEADEMFMEAIRNKEAGDDTLWLQYLAKIQEIKDDLPLE